MQLTIQKKDFLRGLARTHAVAPQRGSMPILANVLLTAPAADVLRLSATDLYLGITTQVPARIERGGSLALNARTLFDVVKNLPEGEVRIEATESAVNVRAGKVKFKLPSASAADFPGLPNADDVAMSSIEVDTLAELVQLTSFSMSTDDSRPHLAGTLFEGDAKTIRMVTTDGHRLSKAEKKLGGDGGLLNFRMLIPHKAVNELRRLLDDVRANRGKGEESSQNLLVGTHGGSVFFKREGLALNVKLADEQFPPYEKVIPQRHQRRVVAGRTALIEALRRVQLVTSDKTGGVQLRIEPGVLRVSSQSSEVGEGSDELDVDFAGEPLTIGFNAKYMVDALSALSCDDVALELSGELDPGTIRPVGDGIDFVGVVMPMRI